MQYSYTTFFTFFIPFFYLFQAYIKSLNTQRVAISTITLYMSLKINYNTFSSVQFNFSVVSDSLYPMDCSTPGLSVYRQLQDLLKCMSIDSVMTSNHLIHCRPLLLPPSIFPSIRVFSNESVLCISWPKYWSFSFNISPSSEHPGLISSRMDWLDVLAVQGTLKSLLQHHSSKTFILWC